VRAERQRGEAIVRYATLALPAAAVLAVGYAVLVAGKSGPVFAARIRGGPTEGASALSFRLETVERFRDGERAVSRGRVRLDAILANGAKLDWEGDLDDEGATNLSLTPPGTVTGPVHVRAVLVSRGGGSGRLGQPTVLVEDDVSAGRDEWFVASRRRGGWVEGHGESPLTVRIAAGRGAFAVPFRDPLIVEVRRGGQGVSNATVRATSEGADIEPADAVTDARGRATLFLRPREHALSVTVHAHAASGEEANLDAALAVVPGALRATLSNGELVVESPIVRDRAYVTLVGDHERILGRTVALSPDGRGGCRAAIQLPELDHRPLAVLHPIWAVVSSESDQRSTSLVGWPLVSSADGPQSTFDVPDLLLADGVAAALAGERDRVGRIRTAGAAVAVAILSLAGALLVLRARRAERVLARHLDENLADTEVSTRLVDKSGGRGWLLVAVVCVALGALLMAAFALWR
jgi:hypothetical protein